MVNSLVDVIIPSQLKNLNWLKESIDSIVNQPEVNQIILCLDTHQADQIDVVKNIYSSDKFKILTSPTSGVGATLNHGLRYATAKYIARQDDDDLSKPNRLFEQITFLEKNAFDMCFTSLDIFSENSPPKSHLVHSGINGGFWKPILTLGSSLNHATLVSKNFYNKENIFYEEGIRAEDFNLWLKIAHIKKIGVLGESLYLYRSHQNQVTKNWNWPEIYDQLFPNWTIFCARLDLPDYIINRDTFNYIFNIDRNSNGYIGVLKLIETLLMKLNQSNPETWNHYAEKILFRAQDIFNLNSFTPNPDLGFNFSPELSSKFTGLFLEQALRQMGQLKADHDEIGRVGHELQLINKDLNDRLILANTPIYKKILNKFSL
jgi:glycosyltransferase involved in cell wall biosynthesis